jgi:autotransporter-associated beta strand protein
MNSLPASSRLVARAVARNEEAIARAIVQFSLLCFFLIGGPRVIKANVPGGVVSGSAAPVTLTSGGSGPTLSNGIVQLVCTTSGAVINQINYTYNNGSGTVTKQILNGAKDGGELYWEFGGFGGSTWTYTDVVDPSTTGSNYAEVAFTSVATGTAAEGDLQVVFSMLRGSPGFYVTLTMTHHAGDIAVDPLGEMRTNIYISPDFNWMSESPVVQRETPLNGPDPPTSVPSFDAPQECSLWTAGAIEGTYEDKYKFSELFGTERVWGWGSISDQAHGVTTGANVGIWNVLASSEYFNGGPMKPELMDAPMVNMLNGGHYEMGSDSVWATGEQWTRVQGPYFVYLNNVSNTITDPVQASQALYNDAVAQGVAEVSGTPSTAGTAVGATAWPYGWLNNGTYASYYTHAAQRGTVTGRIVINDPGNPNASGSNMWVGVVAQPYTADGVYDFQIWYKPYQYWVQADSNGNFTIPWVLSGTSVAATGAAETSSYTLYAFGPGAEGTFMSQNQIGGNPPWLYNLPATPFGVTVTGGSTTNLGNVTWTPTRVGPTVFEIGYPDRTGHKFRHGDDWWVGDIGPGPTDPSPIWTKFLELPFDFPNGVNYTVGTSRWPTDWFFIQPVIINASNADTNSSSTINFNLASAPVTGGTASLYLGIASDYSGQVSVTVNGTNLGSASGVTAMPNAISTSGFTPSYDISDTSVREGCNAAFSDERLNFPASLLHSGSNTITLGMNQIGTPYGADHFMYDYLRLELTGYVPPPPGTVSAYAGNGGVLLSWSATPGATSYNVLRSATSGGTYSPVATGVIGPVCGSGPSNSTYLDTTASNGTPYYYVVQSLNPTGASANSSQSPGVTPSTGGPTTAPVAPTSLSSTVTSGTVSLTWTASSGANYYTVQRQTVIDKIPNFSPTPTLTSTSTILSTIILSNTVTGLGYTDTSVTNGSKYAYTVFATNAAGTSGSSNTVVAKPAPAATPSAPINVSATVGSGQAILNWSAVPGAVGYIIEVSNSPTGPFTYLISVADLTYTETGLTSGKTYYYEIIAVNSDGVSANSAEVSTAPLPPTSLTATPGDTQITLTWPTVAAATSYAVDRSGTSGGPYSLIGTSAGPSYTDSGLTNGTPYYYVVASVNSTTGTGVNSTEATATPNAAVPVAPANLVATATNGGIALAWNVSSGASSYELLRSTANGGPYANIAAGLTATTATDTNVLAGLTYYYVVTTANASGTGAYSNQASAIIPGNSTFIWTGTSSTAWDYTTENWVTTSGTPVTYSDGVNVIFSDTATTTTVAIAGSVNPNSVDFTNATRTYTINSATAGLSGSASIIKSGNAEVILTGSNSYSGGTSIGGGTYALGADSSQSASTVESPGLTGGICGSLGTVSGTVLVDGGGELRFGGVGGAAETFIIPNPITINGGSIDSADAVQEITGGLTINSGGASLLTAWSGKNLEIESTLSGSGNLTINDFKVSGSDTTGGYVLVAEASNPYNGTITISPPSSGYLGGILEIGNNTALINATIIDNNTTVTGLLFTTTAPQIGALGGSGSITLPSTSLIVGGDGASTTYSGVLSGAGGLTKSGTGTMILAATNTYTGATAVTGGILEITGAIAGSASLSVSSGAVLYLDGGTLSISGSITNNGTVKLSGAATISLSGTFTNKGVLDLIDGSQTLPADFVNDGTVLNANSVQVEQVAVNGLGFSLTIKGYAQHTYQLQSANSLVAPVIWTNVGTAQTGTGGTLTFSDAGATGTNGFYRVLVSP